MSKMEQAQLVLLWLACWPFMLAERNQLSHDESERVSVRANKTSWDHRHQTVASKSEATPREGAGIGLARGFGQWLAAGVGNFLTHTNSAWRPSRLLVIVREWQQAGCLEGQPVASSGHSNAAAAGASLAQVCTRRTRFAFHTLAAASCLSNRPIVLPGGGPEVARQKEPGSWPAKRNRSAQAAGQWPHFNCPSRPLSCSRCCAGHHATRATAAGGRKAGACHPSAACCRLWLLQQAPQEQQLAPRQLLLSLELSEPLSQQLPGLIQVRELETL